MKFLAALVAITSVYASPFFNLDPRSNGLLESRDLSGSQCVDFVYGNTNTKLGQVCVAISGGTLTVTYPDISGTYTDLHVTVQISPITEDNQGKWQYTLGNGKCQVSGGTASCSIPVENSWRTCGTTLYIGVHASFTLGGTSATGWGNGPCIPGSRQGNCPKSFSMTTTCTCPVVFAYEPISTSAEYPVTVVTTTTVYCSTTPAGYSTTTSCNDPSATTANTITTTTSVNLVCPSPTATTA